MIFLFKQMIFRFQPLGFRGVNMFNHRSIEMFRTRQSLPTATSKTKRRPLHYHRFNHHGRVVKVKSGTLPETNSLHLIIDGWKDFLSFLFGAKVLFSESYVIVLGRVCLCVFFET